MMVDDHLTREKYPLHPAWFLGIQRVPGGLGCQWSNLQSWGCVDKQCSNQWSSPVLDYTQPRLWGYELCSSMFQQQSRSFKCSTTTKNTRDKQAHLFTLFSKHVCILNESQWHQGNITSFFVGKQNQHVTFRQARKSLMLCGLAVRKHGSDSHRAWRPTIWHQTQLTSIVRLNLHFYIHGIWSSVVTKTWDVMTSCEANRASLDPLSYLQHLHVSITGHHWTLSKEMQCCNWHPGSLTVLSLCQTRWSKLPFPWAKKAMNQTDFQHAQVLCCWVSYQRSEANANGCCAALFPDRGQGQV